MKSCLKYPGGKFYLAKQIVSLLPEHKHFCETHFGSGAVLFAKPFAGTSEVVNDINLMLTKFWKVLQGGKTFAAFKRLCEATPFSAVEFDDSTIDRDFQTLCKSDSEWVVSAWRFFIGVRQSYCGAQKSFAPITRNRTRRGMNEQASAWLGAIEGLDAIHDRLQRVVILNDDAVNVIKGQDGKNTLYYVDPPYMLETRSVADHYAHEMSDADHTKLLLTLGSIRGKFILSGYRCPLYDDLANGCGWKRVDVDSPNHMSSDGVKDTRVECLWSNFVFPK